MGFLLVNDGDEWMKLLNGIDLHKLLEESPLKEKPYLCLSEGGGNIIRQHTCNFMINKALFML